VICEEFLLPGKTAGTPLNSRKRHWRWAAHVISAQLRGEAFGPLTQELTAKQANYAKKIAQENWKEKVK
jgi:hypothetical protein